MPSAREVELAMKAQRNKLLAVFMIVIVATGGVIFLWSQGIFDNLPFVTDPDTGEKIPVGQGVKVTGVMVFANDSAINGQTIRGMSANGTVFYIASASDGSFTTNRGPAEGGIFEFYTNIAGCRLYVGTFDIPASENYDHEVYTIGEIVVYTASGTWTCMVIGSAANSYSYASGSGTPGSTNYTQTVNVDQIYTLRIENTQDYSSLFREYTDPRDNIALKPVLWIEIATTTGYSSSSGVETWTNSTSRIFILELEAIVCEGTGSVLITPSFNLNIPNTGTYRICGWIIDGSYLDHIARSQSKIADPETGESVSNYNLFNAYVTVS